MSPSDGPLGRQRSIGGVIVLVLITLGIYALFWIYLAFAELRAHRGEGVSGGIGVLLALVPVAIFLLPSYVGRMYREDAQEPPVSGWTGLWALIPLIGSLVWLAKVQGALNRYWEAKAQSAGESS
jgi:hypothetical protein